MLTLLVTLACLLGSIRATSVITCSNGGEELNALCDLPVSDSWGAAASSETPRIVAVDASRHVAFIASTSDGSYFPASGSRAFFATYNLTASEVVRQQQFHPSLPNADTPVALLAHPHPTSPRLVVASLLDQGGSFVAVYNWLVAPLIGVAFSLSTHVTALASVNNSTLVLHTEGTGPFNVTLSRLDETNGRLTDDIVLVRNVPAFVRSYGLAIDEEHLMAVVSIATDQLLQGDAPFGGIDTVLYRVNLDTSAVEATIQFGNVNDQWPARHHSVVLLHDLNAIFFAGYSEGTLFDQTPDAGRQVFVMKLSLDLRVLWLQYIDSQNSSMYSTALFYEPQRQLLFFDVFDSANLVLPSIASVNVDYGTSSAPSATFLSGSPSTFAISSNNAIYVGSTTGVAPSNITIDSFCLPSVNQCICPAGYAGIGCNQLSTCNPSSWCGDSGGTCVDSTTCNPTANVYFGSPSTKSRRPFVSLSLSPHQLFVSDHQYVPATDTRFTLIRAYHPSNFSVIQEYNFTGSPSFELSASTLFPDQFFLGYEAGTLEFVTCRVTRLLFGTLDWTLDIPAAKQTLRTLVLNQEKNQLIAIVNSEAPRFSLGGSVPDIFYAYIAVFASDTGLLLNATRFGEGGGEQLLAGVIDQGSLYFCGTSKSVLIHGHVNPGGFNTDAVVIKMNATTLAVVATHFEGSNELDVLKSITVDANDNAVYAVGYTQGGGYAQNVLVMRLTLDLKVVWKQVLVDSEPTWAMRFGNAIGVDSLLGIVYITGAIQGAAIDGLFVTVNAYSGYAKSTVVDTDMGNVIGFSIVVDQTSHSVYRVSTVQASAPPIYENTKLQSTCPLSALTGTCACPTPSYSSLGCQQSPCNPNPCLNGGTCEVVDSSTFICHCDRDPEWDGKYCFTSTCPLCNQGACYAARSTDIAANTLVWSSATTGAGLRSTARFRPTAANTFFFAGEIHGNAIFGPISANGSTTVVWAFLNTVDGSLTTPVAFDARNVSLRTIYSYKTFLDFRYFVALSAPGAQSTVLRLDTLLQVVVEAQFPLDVYAMDSLPYHGPEFLALWGTSTRDIYNTTNKGGEDSYVVIVFGATLQFFSATPIFSASGGNDSVRVATFDEHRQSSYAAGMTSGNLGGAHVSFNDIFVAQYSFTLFTITALGHVGSTGDDVCTSIALDTSVGTLFVAGYTTGDFPAFGQSTTGVHSALLAIFTNTLDLADVKLFSGFESSSSVQAVKLAVDITWHALYMAASEIRNPNSPTTESGIVYQLNSVTGERLGQTAHHNDQTDPDYYRVSDIHVDSETHELLQLGMLGQASLSQFVVEAPVNVSQFSTTNASCLCPPGSSGDQCQFTTCDSSPCFHYGVCVPALTSYTCQCASGYYGAHCEFSTDCGLCGVADCLEARNCSNDVEQSFFSAAVSSPLNKARVHLSWSDSNQDTVFFAGNIKFAETWGSIGIATHDRVVCSLIGVPTGVEWTSVYLPESQVHDIAGSTVRPNGTQSLFYALSAVDVGGSADFANIDILDSTLSHVQRLQLSDSLGIYPTEILYNFVDDVLIILFYSSAVSLYGISNNGGVDGYILLLNPVTLATLWSQSTYSLSGNDDYLKHGVVDEAAQYVYAVGDTLGDLGGTSMGALDVFVVKLHAANGTRASNASKVASTESDRSVGVAVDTLSGFVFVALTSSGGFPQFGLASSNQEDASYLAVFTIDDLTLVGLKRSLEEDVGVSQALSLSVDHTLHVLYMAVQHTVSERTHSVLLQYNAATVALTSRASHLEGHPTNFVIADVLANSVRETVLVAATYYTGATDTDYVFSEECLVGDRVVSNQCLCPLGTSGELCTVDACSSNPCLNGGTCVAEYGLFSCVCSASHTGALCNECFGCGASTTCAEMRSCNSSDASPLWTSTTANNGLRYRTGHLHWGVNTSEVFFAASVAGGVSWYGDTASTQASAVYAFIDSATGITISSGRSPTTSHHQVVDTAVRRDDSNTRYFLFSTVSQSGSKCEITWLDANHDHMGSLRLNATDGLGCSRILYDPVRDVIAVFVHSSSVTYAGILNQGELDAYIVKSDALSLTFLGAQTLASSGSERFYAACLDEASEYYYVTGTTTGNLGGPFVAATDSFAAKVDAASLNVVATVKFAGTATDRPADIAVDSRTGLIFVVGSSYGDYPDFGLTIDHNRAATLAIFTLDMVLLDVQFPVGSYVSYGVAITIDPLLHIAYLAMSVTSDQLDFTTEHGVVVQVSSVNGATLGETSHHNDVPDALYYQISDVLVRTDDSILYQVGVYGLGTVADFEMTTECHSTAVQGNLACVCPWGSSGDGCQQGPCESNPCLNANSHCSSVAAGYVCTCGTGYSGTNCEISDCDLGVCGVNATSCVMNHDGSFECYCDNSHTGRFCQQYACSSDCGTGECSTSRFCDDPNESAALWTSVSSGTAFRGSPQGIMGSGENEVFLFTTMHPGNVWFDGSVATHKSAVYAAFDSHTGYTTATGRLTASGLSSLDCVAADCVVHSSTKFYHLLVRVHSFFLIGYIVVLHPVSLNIQSLQPFESGESVDLEVHNLLFNSKNDLFLMTVSTQATNYKGKSNNGGFDGYVLVLSGSTMADVSVTHVYSSDGFDDKFATACLDEASVFAYAAGTTRGDLGGVQLGVDNVFVVKIQASNGLVAAVGKVGSTAFDAPTSVAVDTASGLVFVGGHSNGAFPAFGLVAPSDPTAMLAVFTMLDLKLLDVQLMTGSTESRGVSIAIDYALRMVFFATVEWPTPSDEQSQYGRVYQLSSVNGTLIGDVDFLSAQDDNELYLVSQVLVDPEQHKVFHLGSRGNATVAGQVTATIMCQEAYLSYATAKCFCPFGVYGDECEVDTTVNVCDSSPCENNATCSPVAFPLYTCDCLPGYLGSNCEQSLCDFNPCASSAACTITMGGSDPYTCTCPSGSTDPTCYLPDCNSPTNCGVGVCEHTAKCASMSGVDHHIGSLTNTAPPYDVSGSVRAFVTSSQHLFVATSVPLNSVWYDRPAATRSHTVVWSQLNGKTGAHMESHTVNIDNLNATLLDAERGVDDSEFFLSGTAYVNDTTLLAFVYSPLWSSPILLGVASTQSQAQSIVYDSFSKLVYVFINSNQIFPGINPGGSLIIYVAAFNASTSAQESLAWIIGTNTTKQQVSEAALSPNGTSVYMLGTSNGPLDDLPNMGGLDMIVYQLDTATGVTLNKRVFGTSSDDEAGDIAVDPTSGAVYVIGTSSGSFIQYGVIGQGIVKAVLIKMDASLNVDFIELHSVTGAFAHGMCVSIDAALGLLYFGTYSPPPASPGNGTAAVTIYDASTMTYLGFETIPSVGLLDTIVDPSTHGVYRVYAQQHQSGSGMRSAALDIVCPLKAVVSECACPLGLAGSNCSRPIECFNSGKVINGVCECTLVFEGKQCELVKSPASVIADLPANLDEQAPALFEALANATTVNNATLGVFVEVFSTVTTDPVTNEVKKMLSETTTSILLQVMTSLVAGLPDLSATPTATLAGLADTFDSLRVMNALPTVLSASETSTPALLLESVAKASVQLPSNDSTGVACGQLRYVQSSSGNIALSAASFGRADADNAVRDVQLEGLPSGVALALSSTTADAVFQSTNCTRLVINTLQSSETFFQPSVRAVRSVIATATFVDVSLPNPLPRNGSVSMAFDVVRNADVDGSVPTCVAWNLTSREWDASGCTVLAYTGNRVTCECTHMTNFAVVFDPYRSEASETVLTAVSYVGVALAIVASASVLVVYGSLRKLRTRPLVLIMLCCVGILATETMFVVDAVSSSAPSLSRGGCFALGLLLHYAMLVQFVALLTVGAGFHYLLHDAKQLTAPIVRRLIVVVFVVPALIVLMYIVVYAAVPSLDALDAYGNVFGGGSGATVFCFVPSGVSMWVTVVAPVAIVLLANLVLYVRITLSMRRQQKLVPERARTSRIGVFISLAVLLGVTWLCAFLVIAIRSVVVQYVFVVCNGLLGVFLFVKYVTLPKVRLGFRELISTWRRGASSSKTLSTRVKTSKSRTTGKGGRTAGTSNGSTRSQPVSLPPHQQQKSEGRMRERRLSDGDWSSSSVLSPMMGRRAGDGGTSSPPVSPGHQRIASPQRDHSPLSKSRGASAMSILLPLRTSKATGRAPASSSFFSDDRKVRNGNSISSSSGRIGHTNSLTSSHNNKGSSKKTHLTQVASIGAVHTTPSTSSGGSEWISCWDDPTSAAAATDGLSHTLRSLAQSSTAPSACQPAFFSGSADDEMFEMEDCEVSRHLLQSRDDSPLNSPRRLTFGRDPFDDSQNASWIFDDGATSSVLSSPRAPRLAFDGWVDDGERQV